MSLKLSGSGISSSTGGIVQPSPTPGYTGSGISGGFTDSSLSGGTGTYKAGVDSSTAYNPASGQPDPRDSEYWANLAKLQATTSQEENMLNLDQASSDTEYQQRLSEAGENRRRDIRDTAESLIGTGLLRSGWHNRKQTEKTIDYTNMLAGWGQEKSASDQKRAAQLAALAQNLGIDEQVLYAGAVGRYTQAQLEKAANDAALAQLAGDASAPTDSGSPAPTYDSATIAKATRIVNNKRDYSKDAIAWAERILYG